jgi:hypothetical protein
VQRLQTLGRGFAAGDVDGAGGYVAHAVHSSSPNEDMRSHAIDKIILNIFDQLYDFEI